MLSAGGAYLPSRPWSFLFVQAIRQACAKVVQGERRTKCETKFYDFVFPSRSLSYPKIVQGERRAKAKSKNLPICSSKPQPILSKDSSRRGFRPRTCSLTVRPHRASHEMLTRNLMIWISAKNVLSLHDTGADLRQMQDCSGAFI